MLLSLTGSVFGTQLPPKIGSLAKTFLLVPFLKKTIVQRRGCITSLDVVPPHIGLVVDVVPSNACHDVMKSLQCENVFPVGENQVKMCGDYMTK